MKKLKPSFAKAVEEAGLMGKQFAWGFDGSLSLGPDLTDDERQKIIDVLKAYQAPDDEPDSSVPMMPMPPAK